MSGTITITPTEVNGERGLNVTGRWPNCGQELWIRFSLHLTQDNSPEVFLVGGDQQLIAFQKTGTGVSDYRDGVRHIDLAKPYRAVFDYEIWAGKPSKGELLTKNSVLSPEITNPSPR
jgi:hypothetical protein